MEIRLSFSLSVRLFFSLFSSFFLYLFLLVFIFLFISLYDLVTVFCWSPQHLFGNIFSDEEWREGWVSAMPKSKGWERFIFFFFATHHLQNSRGGFSTLQRCVSTKPSKFFSLLTAKSRAGAGLSSRLDLPFRRLHVSSEKVKARGIRDCSHLESGANNPSSIDGSEIRGNMMYVRVGGLRPWARQS